ncbi:GNAT family N-acetyltransferase [Actinopolymorpha singaporensis]|uniref:Predicted acetyltransferase, GNAT family n=1 Tax=Actinopolymorpha singaporensis TaxID=117157 RepID=A0A1H1QR20_9ACTN|nr:GNAT family N-acetyltransferase [Actinopolymorpha singaporensis]SDS25921.1 Predicted acetyltransferase, GNAT family [Actinopolymorpha singaporensis]
MYGELTDDPANFLTSAADYFAADPVVNNVLVTNVTGRAAGVITDPAPATYLTVRTDGGEVVAAAMRTPPQRVWLSAESGPAAELAAELLAAACPDAAGVVGTHPYVADFTRAWERLTGAAAVPEMAERLHALDAVTPPMPVPGAPRLATASDRDRLLAWCLAFEADAAEAAGRPVNALTEVERRRVTEAVDLRLAERRAWVWDHDGPVSHLGVTAPVHGVVRIGPVYTPRDRRGRGYASALVAAVSRHELDAGTKTCSLFTDLANPTSNRIYAAVGYRPVRDVTAYRFEPASG